MEGVFALVLRSSNDCQKKFPAGRCSVGSGSRKVRSQSARYTAQGGKDFWQLLYCFRGVWLRAAFISAVVFIGILTAPLGGWKAKAWSLTFAARFQSLSSAVSFG